MPVPMSQLLEPLIRDSFHLETGDKKPAKPIFLLTALIYLLLYVGFFYSAALLDQGGFISSLWYPPAGLTVFGILAFGWLGILLDTAASAITLLLASEWRSEPLSLEALLSGIILHPLAYGAVLLPLRRWIGHRELLNQPNHIYHLLFAALLCTVLATSIGIARLVVLELIDLNLVQSIAITWLIGDFIGIITFAPALLIMPGLNFLFVTDQNFKNMLMSKQGHSMLVGIVILALAPSVFIGIAWTLKLNQFSPFIVLLLLLPLTWLTLRNGLRYAIICVMVMSTGMVIGATLFDYNNHAFEYQLIMITLGLTGLLLGNLVEERNHARRKLEAYSSSLEEHITQQTDDLRKAYFKTLQSEQHLQTLIDTTPIGIAEFDNDGQCIYLNPVGCSLVGLSREEAKGNFVTDFSCAEDKEQFLNIIKTKLPDTGGSQFQFRLEKNKCWVAAHWIRFSDDKDDSHMNSILIFEDITEQREKENVLWKQANFDNLTQLPNRQLFMERLNQGLLHAKRNNEYVGLLWIDLDGFKAINDQYGHFSGDGLLQQIASRLNHRMRTCDTVARMGGDEFAVILSDLTDMDFAIKIADDLNAILAEPYALTNCTCNISVSIGISFYPEHAEDITHLIKYADIAMYDAKESGKNQKKIWRCQDDNT